MVHTPITRRGEKIEWTGEGSVNRRIGTTIFQIGEKMDKEKLIEKLTIENITLKKELGIHLVNFDRLLFLVEENIKIQKRILIILEELKKQKK